MELHILDILIYFGGLFIIHKKFKRDPLSQMFIAFFYSLFYTLFFWAYGFNWIDLIDVFFKGIEFKL